MGGKGTDSYLYKQALVPFKGAQAKDLAAKHWQ